MPLHSQVAYEVILRDPAAWGQQWSHCVASFVEFERAAGFVIKDFYLPNSDLHPTEIKRWFGASCKVSGNVWVALGMGNADNLGRQWCEWWLDLQPPGWTCDQSGTLLKVADIDWSALSKPGSSGMYLMLVCLVWWRQMLEIVTATNDWLATDVTWVLEQLKDGCTVVQPAVQSTQLKPK
jgi:hypothetical protein